MRKMNRSTCVALALFLVLGAGGLRAASSTFTPSIDRWVIGTGGDTSVGSGYALSDTLGQGEAGQTSSGSGYQLTSGFWFTADTKVYLPLVLR